MKIIMKKGIIIILLFDACNGVRQIGTKTMPKGIKVVTKAKTCRKKNRF